MIVPIQNFLSKSSSIDFGQIAASPAELDLYTQLNDEIIDLCRSLPNSVQVAAMNFLMKYSGLTVGDKLDFFSKYPVPSWSILYWICCTTPNSHKEKFNVIEKASAIHAMAMLLHSLDDHLNDGELAACHLLILLRSQAWYKMITAIEILCESFHEGSILAQEYIDAYYLSICGGKTPDSLNSYCDRFHKQMSTAMITPALIMRRFDSSQIFFKDVLQAYCHFGVAWRILDDIQDIKHDLQQTQHSAVYYCLPVDIQSDWNQIGYKDVSEHERLIAKVGSSIVESGIFPKLIKRINHELKSAAALADRQNLPGLADEFMLLQGPLCEIESDPF